MELDYKEIGKRVKIARIRADLTQEALAEKAGLSIEVVQPALIVGAGLGKRKRIVNRVDLPHAIAVGISPLLGYRRSVRKRGDRKRTQAPHEECSDQKRRRQPK